MKKIVNYVCGMIAVVCLAVSCQQNHTYDFEATPTQPKAGEKVTFTNLSDAGENWVWNFGDGGKSTLKNATHTYTAAGTYVVELMADSNRSRIATHVLEVLDSIPSIYVSTDSVPQYMPIVIKAEFYNPSNLDVDYAWEVDEEIFEIVEGDLTSDSIIGYFTTFGRTTEIRLTIGIGEKVTQTARGVVLIDNDAPSLLMQGQVSGLWQQRIYDDIYEVAHPYEGDPSDIESANDSTAELNGVVYDVQNMPVLQDKDVYALQVDASNRKLYVILDDGLYVANANGDALAQIWNVPCSTLLVDTEGNKLYWSDAYGVWVMPLITHPQNIISEQMKERVGNLNELGPSKRMVII